MPCGDTMHFCLSNDHLFFTVNYLADKIFENVDIILDWKFERKVSQSSKYL